MKKAVFICQLPKKERLEIYKKIKKHLVSRGVYSMQVLLEAMENKINDLCFD